MMKRSCLGLSAGMFMGVICVSEITVILHRVVCIINKVLVESFSLSVDADKGSCPYLLSAVSDWKFFLNWCCSEHCTPTAFREVPIRLLMTCLSSGTRSFSCSAATLILSWPFSLPNAPVFKLTCWTCQIWSRWSCDRVYHISSVLSASRSSQRQHAFLHEWAVTSVKWFCCVLLWLHLTRS